MIEADLMCSAHWSEALLEAVIETVTWRRPPTYWSGGRAGWLTIPASDAWPRGVGLKLKGLGAAPTAHADAQPPGTEVYDRWPGQLPDPHFGIDHDNEFCLRLGTPAPVGGLSADSALMEQQCAEKLTRAGVPAVRPVAAFRYPDLAWWDERRRISLGVSVTASPLVIDSRCWDTVPGFLSDRLAAQAAVERLFSTLLLDLAGNSDIATAQLSVLGAVYRAFGESLKAFSAAGWYRYSGHPGKITIDHDGRAMLVDLDSCRPLSELAPDVAALETIRDGMSALYNLSCVFYSLQGMDSLADDQLLEWEPFSGFLDGWDPKTAGLNAGLGRAIASYVLDSRRRLRHFGAFLSSVEPAAEHLYRYARHDRDLTFVWLFRMLYRRRLARPMGVAMPVSLREMDERLLRFCGRPRFDELMSLETRAGEPW